MAEPVDFSADLRLARRPWVRVALLVAGTVSLGVGIVGIFLPVLPTVPFVLLASVCYARASSRYYHWLMNHRILGPPLVEWKRTKSLPAKVKALAIGMIVVSASISLVFLAKPLFVKLVIAGSCSAVIVYLLRIPTRR